MHIVFRAAMAAGLITLAVPVLAAPAPTTTTSVLRMDPALDAIIPKGAVVEKLAGGFGFVEGPLWYRG